jgi:flavin reductase (DIM6/NTAB) family NADH-FMN oxidoreductase RutF
MITLGNVSGNGRELRDAYGRFPSGVTAICALENGVPIGMAASAFVPVSLDPPLVSVCVQSTSSTWPRLRALKRLGISFLGESHDAAARQLAAKTGDRFAGIDWDSTEAGAIFVDGAAAWLECSVDKEITAGDHEIVLFRIEKLTTHPHINPLIFHSSKFHSSVPR